MVNQLQRANSNTILTEMEIKTLSCGTPERAEDLYGSWGEWIHTDLTLGHLVICEL